MFVCTANICRSAYAERAAQALLGHEVDFISAGTHALVGHRMDPPMVRALVADRTRGATADGHEAQQVTRELVESCDLVLTMSARQRHFILDEWPDFAPRTFVIGHAARELANLDEAASVDDLARHLWSRRSQNASDEVADPHRRGQAAADECGATLDAHLSVLTRRLRQVTES